MLNVRPPCLSVSRVLTVLFLQLPLAFGSPLQLVSPFGVGFGCYFTSCSFTMYAGFICVEAKVLGVFVLFPHSQVFC